MGCKRKDLLAFRPTPLQVRIVEETRPDGTIVTGLYQIWRGGVGRMCRRCSADRCSLKAIPGTDLASCIVVVTGRVEPELAPWFSPG